MWSTQPAGKDGSDRRRETAGHADGVGARRTTGLLDGTATEPLQRAYQRDPEAIEAWRLERYPAIARQAKASGGEVYFWDESGFRADSVHGRTWGKQGQTPVVERPCLCWRLLDRGNRTRYL
jgi:hypothetical protein